jgi:hypothetical protein
VNFLELCQATRQELGISGTGPTSVAGQTGQNQMIVDWVREADLFVQRLHADWNFLWDQWTQALTVGTDTYDAPTDLSFWDLESFVIDRGTVDAMGLYPDSYKSERDNITLREQATPVKFTILPNGKVRLYPPPDKAHTLSADYWKAPVEMSANTDESVIPEQYRRIVIVRAKMFFVEEEQVFDQYQVYGAEFATVLNSLEAHSLPGQQFRAQAQAIPTRVIPH